MGKDCSQEVYMEGHYFLKWPLLCLSILHNFSSVGLRLRVRGVADRGGGQFNREGRN